MEWIKNEENFNVPVKSWCKDIEDGAMAQAADLAKHPVVFRHVALMPDCHQGFGMPIGGVIACTNAVIPNAVGVDIESFMSCSHDAGRVMGRMQATRSLTPKECDQAMEGIVYGRWR